MIRGRTLSRRAVQGFLDLARREKRDVNRRCPPADVGNAVRLSTPKSPIDCFVSARLVPGDKESFVLSLPSLSLLVNSLCNFLDSRWRAPRDVSGDHASRWNYPS